MIRPRGLSIGGRNVSALIKLAILPLLQFSFDFNAKATWRHFFKPDLPLPPIRRTRRSKPDINMSRASIFLVCAHLTYTLQNPNLISWITVGLLVVRLHQQPGQFF